MVVFLWPASLKLLFASRLSERIKVEKKRRRLRDLGKEMIVHPSTLVYWRRHTISSLRIISKRVELILVTDLTSCKKWHETTWWNQIILISRGLRTWILQNKSIISKKPLIFSGKHLKKFLGLRNKLVCFRCKKAETKQKFIVIKQSRSLIIILPVILFKVGTVKWLHYVFIYSYI